jgi:hypothetical protein
MANIVKVVGVGAKYAKRLVVGSNKDAKNKSADRVFQKYMGTTTINEGKAKVIRRVNNLNEIADARTGGYVGYQYKKKKLTDVIGGTGTTKVKARNLGKITKKMAPSSKQQIKKYAKRDKTVGPFGTPKVPVKRKAK